jgi:hypothetical protein
MPLPHQDQTQECFGIVHLDGTNAALQSHVLDDVEKPMVGGELN